MYDIVIVEDEELERQALRSILSENIQGVRIVGEARSGPEAVRLIDTCNIDLMLVDINIPKLNGLEVVRHLRDQHADTKVIIITAYDYFDMTRAAIHLKVDEYLLKPIRTQVLVSSVKSCIQQLSAAKKCREIAHVITDMLERDVYQECVALVREYSVWMFTQQEFSVRDLVLDLAAALSYLANEKGRRFPDALNQRLSLLRATRFKDYDSRSQIEDLFLGIVDLLFNVHGEEHSRYARDTVQRAVNFIERNLSRDVTLEIVADAVDISSCYLSRLFKKTLNVNFVTYLTNRRMELAKELLVSTELPVSSIAMDLSYKDVSYFGKSFKKLVGMSPSGYRDHSRLAQGGMRAQ